MQQKKKWEPPAAPTRVGKKQKRQNKGASLGSKLPIITPNAKCKLRLLKLERVKDYLLMEEQFVKQQELHRPQDEKNQEDRTKVAWILLLYIACPCPISHFAYQIAASCSQILAGPCMHSCFKL